MRVTPSPDSDEARDASLPQSFRYQEQMQVIEAPISQARRREEDEAARKERAGKKSEIHSDTVRRRQQFYPPDLSVKSPCMLGLSQRGVRVAQAQSVEMGCRTMDDDGRMATHRRESGVSAAVGPVDDQPTQQQRAKCEISPLGVHGFVARRQSSSSILFADKTPQCKA